MISLKINIHHYVYSATMKITFYLKKTFILKVFLKYIFQFFSMRLPKTQRSPYATCLAYSNTTSMINQKKPWTPNNTSRYSSRSANQIHASPRKTPTFQQFHNSKADVNGLKQCYRRICNVCFLGSFFQYG